MGSSTRKTPQPQSPQAKLLQLREACRRSTAKSRKCSARCPNPPSTGCASVTVIELFVNDDTHGGVDRTHLYSVAVALQFRQIPPASPEACRILRRPADHLYRRSKLVPASGNGNDLTSVIRMFVRALRSRKMFWVRLPSSTKLSGQTARSSSSAIRRRGFRTIYNRTSKAFGGRAILVPSRRTSSCRPASRSDGPKTIEVLHQEGHTDPEKP